MSNLNKWVRWDPSSNTTTAGPQSCAGSEGSWYHFTPANPGRTHPSQSYSYALVENKVVESLVVDSSHDYTEPNRKLRNFLLQETTQEGWGDVDYRATQTTETVAAWDTYRAALRNLPATVSTFATAELTASDLPTKP
jgi:hypothetical protein